MPKPLQPGFAAVQFVLSPESPKFGGMRREGHRFSIPVNQFYDLQNTRLVGGEIVARGGQSKGNASALSGTAVTGIYDDAVSGVNPAPIPTGGGGGGGLPPGGGSGEKIYYTREPT